MFKNSLWKVILKMVMLRHFLPSEEFCLRYLWTRTSCTPEGGYSLKIPTGECAAQWGHDIGTSDLEWDIHFQDIPKNRAYYFECMKVSYYQLQFNYS